MQHVRNRPGRPAAVHDLLDPRVVRDVSDPVRRHQGEVRARRDAQPAAADGRNDAREQRGAEQEQHAVHAVMVAVVHVHADRVEAQVGREPRHADEERDDRSCNADAIAGLPAAPLHASPRGDRGQRQRDQHADCGKRVHGPRVEIGLAHDARPEHRGAQDAPDER